MQTGSLFNAPGSEVVTDVRSPTEGVDSLADSLEEPTTADPPSGFSAARNSSGGGAVSPPPQQPLSTTRRVQLAVAVIALLLLGGFAFVITRGARNFSNQNDIIANTTPTQAVMPTLNSLEVSAKQPLLLQGAASSELQFIGAQGSTTLLFAEPTLVNSITFPNASGLVCVNSNNCGYATQAELTQLAGTVQQVQPGQPAVPGATGVTSLNGAVGTIVVQGSPNQIIVSGSNVITIATPQDIAFSSSPQFAGLTLTGTGTQNGSAICDASNNCNYAPASGSGNYIWNGTGLQSNANFNIRGAAAGNVVGAIRGAAGQTANIFEVQEESGSTVISVDSGGNLGVGSAAPNARLEVAGGRTFLGTGTLTAHDQNNVILFSNAAGTAAQAGNFQNALILYGGGGQTRTLRLSQNYNGAAYIDTNFSELRLRTLANNANIVLEADGAGQIILNNITQVAALGAATGNSLVCRNNLNQLAACTAIPGTGDINQDGNMFGENVVIGAQDDFGMDFITHNTVVQSLSNTGQATFQNAVDSATAFQIQNAAGTAVFNYDTTDQTLTLRAGTDQGVTGSELANNDFSGDWTGSGWTLGASDATHNTGNTDTLEPTTPLTITGGNYYIVSYQVSNRNAGSVNFTLGNTAGTAVINNATTAQVVRAGNVDNLILTPTSDFDGTISNVSVKQVTPFNSVLTGQKTDGETRLEVRVAAENGTLLIGRNVGMLNQGGNNVALGYDTFAHNTTGNGNTALGANALQHNVTGSVNTALGYLALQFNTTGSNNVAVGWLALGHNTSGGDNVAVGRSALELNLTGEGNVALGQSALHNNTTGSRNIAIGQNTMGDNTSGELNVAIGGSSLNRNTTGQLNVVLGHDAGRSITTGDGNLVLQGMRDTGVSTTGTQNVALGWDTLNRVTSGQRNVAVGSGAGQGITTGEWNLAIFGMSNTGASTTGSNNIAIGRETGNQLTSGELNTIVGHTALNRASTGSRNIVLGEGAGNSITTGTFNIALGGLRNAGVSTTGSNNIALGDASLHQLTSGSNNIAVGSLSLGSTTGDNNVAIGLSSGRSNTTGSNNTYLGTSAGEQDGNWVTVAALERSTAIGYAAQVQQNDSMVLGKVQTDGSQTKVGIGTTMPTNLLSVAPVFYNTGQASQSGTTISGSGTTWTADMVGKEIVFAEGIKAMITGFTNATTLTAGTSQSVSQQDYRIHYAGLQVTTAGKIGANTMTINNYFSLNTAETADNDAQGLVSTGGAGNKGMVIQGVSGQTANLQEWQDNTGAVLAFVSAAGDLEVVNATVTGTLTVTGAATFNNTLTVNGHIITGNTSGSTTVAAEAGAGAGASASVSGNDTSGTITLNTGTGAAAGDLATVTFANAYGAAPQVVITPKAVPGGGTFPQYHYDSSTGTFTLKSFNALTDSATYTFTYFITQ